MTRLAAVLLLAVSLPAASQDNPESLEREAARLLLVGARGAKHEPGDEFEKLICGLKVGGLILFDRDVEKKGAPRNIRSMRQLRGLTEDLQRLAKFCGNAPLLIAVDVEGGAVNRLSALKELKKVKSHSDLGKGDPRGTYEEAVRIGRAMNAAGLNWTLAPVVDVDVNPDNPVIGRHGRSFSSDPQAVTRHAHAFIRGLRSFGVLNCIKHFPGHGSSLTDSHLDAVDVSKTSRPEEELFPYRLLVERGIVDCVMTAHIFDDKVDPERIVTFSSAAVQGLLRGEIGFEGLVISDDLQMRAVSRRHPTAEAAVLAVAAGTDMVTISNNRRIYDDSVADRVHTALIRAVKEGRLPRERVREAAKRVLRLREKLDDMTGRAKGEKE